MLTAAVAEVDDDIGALAGREHQILQRDGSGQQALVGADLMELEPIAQGEAVEAGVGGIQDAEAILARLDFKIRKQLAVDQNGVTEDFRNPGRMRITGYRIIKLAVGRDEPVEDGERDFIFTAGQVQPVFELIANDGDTE